MSHKTKRFSFRLGTSSIHPPAMLYISNLTQSDRLALFEQPIQLVRRSLLYLISHQISNASSQPFQFQYACQFLMNMLKLFSSKTVMAGNEKSIIRIMTSTNCVKINGFLTKMKSLCITAHNIKTFHNVFFK